MQNSHSITQNMSLISRRLSKLFFISFLLFIASPNYAIAYGGHGYNYGYGHHGYRGHYGHHGGIGTAGYVILGILGVAVLSQILDNDNDRDRRYRESRTYKLPTQPRHDSVEKKPKPAPVYNYSENEGWDSLAKGNANYALDIFAIQSQQNLNSGIPKIGFAIAAATNGDSDRAIRAMRKAVRVDASALEKIEVDNIKLTLEALSKVYDSSLNSNRNNDNTFMLATLSYMQKDYETAKVMISNNDQSQSANILRKLIATKQS